MRRLNEAIDPISKIQNLIAQANDTYHQADNEQGGTEWPLMDRDGNPYGLSSDIKLDGRGYVIIPFTAWQYSEYSQPVKIRVLKKVGGKVKIITGDYYEEGWKDVSKMLKRIIKDAQIGIGHFKEYDPNWEETSDKSSLRDMNKKIGRNAKAGMENLSENKKPIRINKSLLNKIIKESIKKIFENTLDVDDSDIWKYADFDSESKWLDSFGKMPKGYDKDINDDETIDMMIAMNNGCQNTISPSGKRAEKLASWDAFDRDRDENNKWITRDEDEMDNDENFNIYESVKRNVRQVLKETSYDLARMAHKSTIHA